MADVENSEDDLSSTICRRWIPLGNILCESSLIYLDRYTDDNPKPLADEAADPTTAAGASAPSANDALDQADGRNGDDSAMNYEEHDEDSEVEFGLWHFRGIRRPRREEERRQALAACLVPLPAIPHGGIRLGRPGRFGRPRGHFGPSGPGGRRVW